MATVLFLFKKIISQLFLPLPVVLFLMISGLAFLWMTRRKNGGKFFIALGLLLLFASSYGFIADRFAETLERRYPPLLDVENINDYKDIRWIVVLGGGSHQDERLPASSRLTASSLKRLLEGVRLHQALPAARLILSGGAVFQDVPEGKMLADAAVLMGVKESAIVMETQSLDTDDQARVISALVGRDRFILVTSAVHIPRSMANFRRYGMHPIAAPTDYLAVKKPRLQPADFFPGAESLRTVEATIHEYLGILWMRLKP